MSDSTHTATSGPTLTQKWGGRLGHTGLVRIPPPESIFGMLIGRYNSGKSSLLQSCEEAFIINTDQSSVLQPNAVVWPVFDTKTGRLIDADNTPIVMSYEKVQAKRDLLVQLAKDNQPRPRLVAIDTLGSFLALLRDYCVRNAAKLGLKSGDITDFKQLDGRAAYGWMYDELLNFSRSLRDYGYGFYYVAHIVDVRRQVKSGDEVIWASDPEVSFTDAIAERLYPMFEMVAEVKKKRGTEEFSETQVIDLKDGKSTTMVKKGSRSVYKHYLVTRSDELPEGTLKPRIKMPAEIILPEQDSWKAFAAEYMKYAVKS